MGHALVSHPPPFLTLPVDHSPGAECLHYLHSRQLYLCRVDFITCLLTEEYPPFWFRTVHTSQIILFLVLDTAFRIEF